MYLYKNCQDLPIFNFDVIYRTNDFKFLVVGYDGYKDIQVPKGANERWQEIKNEWVKLLDDNVIIQYYQLILETTYLQTRYNVVKSLLEQIYKRDMDSETMESYIEALAKWKYHWNKKNEKLVEIKRLLKQLKASQNKISLKLDLIEKMQKENNFTDDVSSLEKQQVVLEKITGIRINIKKDSTAKWIEICKLATEINEQKRRNGK